MLKLPFCKEKTQKAIKKAFTDGENPIDGSDFSRCKNLNELKDVLEKYHALLGLAPVQASHVTDHINFDDEGGVEGEQ